MKRTTRTLLCIVLFAMAAPVNADDKSEKSTNDGAEVKRYFDYYLGEWTITKEGTDETGKAVGTNTENGRAHHITFEFTEGSFNGIWGYDPGSKRWIGRGFGTDGYIEMWSTKPKGRDVVKPGDVIRLTQEVETDDGRVSHVWTHTVKSMDHYVETYEGDDPSLAGTYIYHRKAPKLPDSVREVFEKHFVGSWSATSTQGEEAHEKIRWSASKSSLIVNGKWRDASGHTVKYTRLIGWEADTNHIVDKGFESDGGHYSARYTSVEGEKWTGHISGYTGGKRFDHAPATMEWSKDSRVHRDQAFGDNYTLTFIRKAEK